MALKDILIHIDNSKSCAGRLDAAMDLARAHDAHLTGLYIIPAYIIPPYAEAQIGPDIIEAQQEAARARAAEAEAMFKTAIDKAGVKAEWRCYEGDLTNTVNLHAHYVDLVIAGQADDSDPESMDPGFGENIVLESGRPVLFIPYIGAARPIGKRVIVAWKPGREAIRALNDALPLLQKANKVEVMTVNPPAGDEGDIPGADICLHLARHGIRAEAHRILVNDIDVGNLLLSRAADEDVDLIVMGAYGHSRFREMILGGATRHILKHMTVPVLMSH